MRVIPTTVHVIQEKVATLQQFAWLEDYLHNHRPSRVEVLNKSTTVNLLGLPAS